MKEDRIEQSKLTLGAQMVEKDYRRRIDHDARVTFLQVNADAVSCHVFIDEVRIISTKLYPAARRSPVSKGASVSLSISEHVHL